MNTTNKIPGLGRKVFLRAALVLPTLTLIIILSAGRWNYWQGWMYMLTLIIPMFFIFAYLLKNDPALLERRMRMREKELVQRRIVSLTYLYFLVAFVMLGLDVCFGWSNVPPFVSILADAFFFAGYMVFLKAGYQIREAIVELENPGPRIQEAGVGFGDVKRSVRTDEQGVAKTGIHGAPQKRPLGIDPQTVIKRATVRANVQLKPADLFRDLADALKGPWVLPAQVLYRSHLVGKNFTFKVRDWRPRLVLEMRSAIVSSDKRSPDPAQSEAKARIPLHSPEAAVDETTRLYKGEGMLSYKTVQPQNWNPCMALVKGEGTVGMRIFQAIVQ